MLDSHQHFWKIERGDYDWMGPHVAPLLRNFMPEDLSPLLRSNGVTQTILVQAAETEAETEFLLQLAAETDFVMGVVGWLDMDSEGFPERWASLSRNPYLVGLRPMLQQLPDDDWILRPRVLQHLKLVAEAGLSFDVLAFPRHLPFVINALETVPSLRAVIDHLAKPPIKDGVVEPWTDLIARAATRSNTWCKVSGMVTEASANWSIQDFAPYVDHVVRVFGPDRIMFGSDWPVCTLAASYEQVMEVARSLLSRRCTEEELRRIFQTNGLEFYRRPLDHKA